MWQCDIFTIFSFSNLIHSLLALLRELYFKNKTLLFSGFSLTYFVNFLNIFQYLHFDTNGIYERFNKKKIVFANQIFFQNAMVQTKLLSVTYWYSKLQQNIIAQFQPRKFCQDLIYFLEAIVSFSFNFLGRTSIYNYQVYLSS